MKFSTNSFAPNGPIPGEFAFCVPAESGHVALAPNRNPHLAWSDLPAGTQSLALIVHDPDVPSVGDDVNQEGRSVPAALPRVDFFHWVLVDLAPEAGEIAAGEFSDGVSVRGKPGPIAPRGTRQGINDYTGWFAGDHDMEGDYFGFDGCCPPWNDEIVHHYHFTLYALDIPTVPVEGSFTGQQARDAIQGHILDQASFVGLYTLNPAVNI